MTQYNLIANSAAGLESVVASELRKLGYNDLKIENGKVCFEGDELAICRTNMWLRSSDRILIKAGEFKALSFEELFENTKSLPWESWLPVDASFPVEGKSNKSKLFSVPDCQSIVKKAIVERLKSKYKKEWFEETGAEYKIELSIRNDIALITIDTSGTALHKRGYRAVNSEAPMKETLAAALIELSFWNKDRILVDPLCGSGTIPIEAALIGRNIAPGINRKFASERWNIISDKSWKSTKEEAADSIRNDIKLHIKGSDIDGEVLDLAREHAENAGVASDIDFECLPVSQFTSDDKFGCIICNPPYGERLSTISEVQKLYKEMGNSFKKLDTWSYYIFSAYHDFERYFGKRADKKRKLYNGRIECNYYQYFGPKPAKD